MISKKDVEDPDRITLPTRALMMSDRYYMAYKPNHFHYSIIFTKMKFLCCYSCMMFIMKSMSICDNKVNCDEIIIEKLLVIDLTIPSREIFKCLKYRERITLFNLNHMFNDPNV